MPVREILQLGNPVLRVNCPRVTTFGTETLRTLARDLEDTLEDFRVHHGFGRGIAAPQIGEAHRVIFTQTVEPRLLVNPVIARRSRRLVVLWDDCFSFPNLLVKVRRNLSVVVHYQDIEGRKHRLSAEGALSELLQHEIDHINGILAVDRAIDSKHIVFRSELEKWGRTERMVL